MKLILVLHLTSFLVFFNGCDNSNRSYHSNGNIKDEIPYVDGKIEGVRKKYYENGQLEKEIEYRGGIPNGKYKEYSREGGAVVKSILINGLQDGEVVTYYESGEVKSKYYMKNGLSHGDFYSYHINGIMKMHAIRDNDVTVYYHEYNEQGELIGDVHSFETISLSGDTLTLGSVFKLKTQLLGPIEYGKVVYNVYIKGQLPNTEYMNIEITNEDGYIYFEYVTDKIGIYTVVVDAICFNEGDNEPSTSFIHNHEFTVTK